MTRIYGRYEVAEPPVSDSGGPMPGRDPILETEVVLYWWKPHAAEFQASEDKAQDMLKGLGEPDGQLADKHSADDQAQVFADSGYIYLVAPNVAAAQATLAKLQGAGLFPASPISPSTPPTADAVPEAGSHPPAPIISQTPAPPPRSPEPQPATPSVSPPRARSSISQALITAGAIALTAFVGAAATWLLWPPTITLHADRTVLTQGEPLHLDWTSTHAQSVSIDPDLPAQPPSGQVVVYPRRNTTYTATAKGHVGTIASRLDVIVDPPLFMSFTSDQSSVPRGENTRLHWQVSGAAHASIEPDIGNVLLTDGIAVSPTQRKTYKLTATRPSGRTDIREITIDVTDPDEIPLISGNDTEPNSPRKRKNLLPAISFTASPPSVPQCGSVTLRWSVRNADHVSIDPVVQDANPSGSTTVPLARSAVFVLAATGPGGHQSSTPLEVPVVQGVRRGPAACGEIVWMGIAKAGGTIVIESEPGGTTSNPPATSISAPVPRGVRVRARENYVKVTGQPATLGEPKVILSSRRGGALTIHLWWER
jgi:hypothetical protein